MSGLFEPDRLWDAFEQGSRGRGGFQLAQRVIAMAVVGAFGIALASEIGVRLFNTDWNYVAGYTTQRSRGFGPFFMLWAMALLLPIAQGLIAAALLPMYSRPRRWARGVAVAVMGSIPVYLAGLTLVFLPGILLVAFAFLISCAWWASGSRRLLGVQAGDSADFVAASLVGSSALIFFVSAAVPL